MPAPLCSTGTTQSFRPEPEAGSSPPRPATHWPWSSYLPACNKGMATDSPNICRSPSDCSGPSPPDFTDYPAMTEVALLVAAANDSESLDEVLAAVSALISMTASTAALEPAVTAGLIRMNLSRLQFRHPLVRPPSTRLRR